MNEIKFSYRYDKLTGIMDGSIVKLLQVVPIHYKDLSEAFKEFDCRYGSGENVKYYDLPNNELLLLIFQDIDTSKVFPTLRRSTPEKMEYYKKLQGQQLELVILSERK